MNGVIHINKKLSAILVSLIFAFPMVIPAGSVRGAQFPGSRGSLVSSSQPIVSFPFLRGLTFHSEDPFLLDFIVYPGSGVIEENALEAQTNKFIKYFLASLTLPEKNFWVNLSSDETDKIVSEDFGQTEMDRDLLEQDFQLKKRTAELLNPQHLVGKIFWGRVYAKTRERFGTTDLPVDIFQPDMDCS